MKRVEICRYDQIRRGEDCASLSFIIVLMNDFEDTFAVGLNSCQSHAISGTTGDLTEYLSQLKSMV